MGGSSFAASRLSNQDANSFSASCGRARSSCASVFLKSLMVLDSLARESSADSISACTANNRGSTEVEVGTTSLSFPRAFFFELAYIQALVYHSFQYFFLLAATRRSSSHDSSESPSFESLK